MGQLRRDQSVARSAGGAPVERVLDGQPDGGGRRFVAARLDARRRPHGHRRLAECGDAIDVGDLASTMMLCADEAIAAQETAFFAALGGAQTWQIDETGKLVLEGASRIVAEPGPAQAAGSPGAAGLVGAWDLAELELHITSGNPEQAKTALTRIEAEHRDNPDVAAALYRLLYETGVIPEAAHTHGPMHEEAPAAAGSVPEPAGRIWTPDSERPTGGKSALWTPS